MKQDSTSAQELQCAAARIDEARPGRALRHARSDAPRHSVRRRAHPSRARRDPL